jgi:signal transduction histidine kinase
MTLALRRSITKRMLVASGALALLVGAAFVVLVLAITEQRDSGRLAVKSQQAISAGASLEKLAIDLETGVRGYVASGKGTFLEPWRAARREYPAQARRLVALLSGDPAQQRAAKQLNAAIDDYVNLYSIPMIELARDDLDVARSVIVNGTGRDRLAEIRRDFRRLFASERALASSREQRAESRSSSAILLGVGGFAVTMGLTLLLAVYLSRSIVRPVQRVAVSAEKIAGGDLDARVPDQGPDEIGYLGRAFNSMARSLELSRDEVAERTAELERSNRELEQYAAVTSHDLKEPLQTVSVYAGLLDRHHRGDLDETGRHYLQTIIGGTERMRTLIRDLLEYSRLGHGQLEPERVETDPLVGRALDNLAATIGEKDATVTADRLPAVDGDPKQLAQVFQNLLSNALKFSDQAAPQVHVGATRENGAWRFSVSDNGIGIEPAQAERIFQPFARVGGGDYDGTGIGLAIVHKIVERHGGQIWVDSEPGAGSTFYFTVPTA